MRWSWQRCRRKFPRCWRKRWRFPLKSAVCLIDQLIESLDEGPAEEGVEEALDEEIKRRVDDIRSGKVKMIPGERVLRELAKEFPDEK